MSLAPPAAPFYDVLAANDSALEAMGNSESIREQATNSKSSPPRLVTQARKNGTIDWTLRAVTAAKQRPGFPVTAAKQWPGFQSDRAKIKFLVKRILRKRGY